MTGTSKKTNMEKSIELKKHNDVESLIKDIKVKWHWWDYIHSWFLRGIRKVTYLPKEVKWFFQRGRKGYSSCDVWGFNYHLAKVIRDGVKELRKQLHGHPINITLEEWKHILLKIEWTFNVAYNIIDYNWYYQPTSKWDDEVYKKHCNIASDFNRNLDISAHAMTKEECRRYEEGWKLFQKWFSHLWN